MKRFTAVFLVFQLLFVLSIFDFLKRKNKSKKVEVQTNQNCYELTKNCKKKTP
jgi:hypothetical protein